MKASGSSTSSRSRLKQQRKKQRAINQVIVTTTMETVQSALRVGLPVSRNPTNAATWHHVDLDTEQTGVIGLLSPEWFREIRQKFNIVEAESVESLTSVRWRQKEENKERGNSESVIFFTEDGRFVIKTINEAETKLFIDILEDLKDHLVKSTTTYLPAIISCFVENDHHGLTYIVMRNICLDGSPAATKYDLKGDPDRTKAIDMSVLRDSELRTNHPGGIRLKEEERQEVETILTQDLEFLELRDLVDYSLLLMLDNVPLEDGTEHRLIGMTAEGEKLLRMGIIDIVQRKVGGAAKKWKEQVLGGVFGYVFPSKSGIADKFKKLSVDAPADDHSAGPSSSRGKCDKNTANRKRNQKKSKNRPEPRPDPALD